MVLTDEAHSPHGVCGQCLSYRRMCDKLCFIVSLIYVLRLGIEARALSLLGKHATPAQLIVMCKAHRKEAEELVY